MYSKSYKMNDLPLKSMLYNTYRNISYQLRQDHHQAKKGKVKQQVELDGKTIYGN